MLRFPITDAHLHVWDTSRFRYPWLDGNEFLNRKFLLEDYNKACGPLKVDKIVFMQCDCEPSSYQAEVEWVTGLAKADPRIQGIVSYAPLDKGEGVRPELEALRRNKLVKGVRQIIQNEPELDFCLKPSFIQGVKMLAEFNFTFDICIDYRHTRNTIRLVEQCPEIPFIVDHIGKPDIKGGMLDPWREEMTELSRFSNVYCKVSSLATEADHRNWTIDELQPYVDHVVECFGFERTVFASDWPVSAQAASLGTCVETLEKLLDGASEEQFKKLFYANANAFYGL